MITWNLIIFWKIVLLQFANLNQYASIAKQMKTHLYLIILIFYNF